MSQQKGSVALKTASSPAAKKAAVAAINKALSATPATPWKAKRELHPPGEFELEVTHVWVKLPELTEATEITPAVTAEPGKTLTIRVQLTSEAGSLTESFSIWVDQKKNENVWIGLGPVLQALQVGTLADFASVEALVGAKAMFTVRHELIPAKGEFKASTRATIRPEPKQKGK